MVPADQLVDVCPRCGWEVFSIHIYTNTTIFKCIELPCDWTGKDPILKLKKNYYEQH